jgi:hypothetical protein
MEADRRVPFSIVRSSGLPVKRANASAGTSSFSSISRGGFIGSRLR